MNKTYMNGAVPKRVQLRTTKEGDTALIIDFHPDETWTGDYDPSIWLTLKPDYNESNVKAVMALGAQCPAELTPNAALKLQIVPGPTLVLVDGKPRYINEGRPLRVFDNR